ncbi:MAG: GNAT family N-acetyltransferase [Alphaproteobacteria bacterium]|nr:GNAT family N-acetyltransferase [Alphaproteobacteria bacterium]
MTLALAIRNATPTDAGEIARVYIESWHDTYPGVLSKALLSSMKLGSQTGRWRAAICQGEIVLVAEIGGRVAGMLSAGPSRDRTLGFDGEVYTLYVDPAHYGEGAGRNLLAAAFSQLRKRGCRSCLIWAHAQNHARFFYERMGGRLVAERTAKMMGDPVPEVAFGWKSLETVQQSPAR